MLTSAENWTTFIKTESSYSDKQAAGIVRSAQAEVIDAIARAMDSGRDPRDALAAMRALIGVPVMTAQEAEREWDAHVEQMREAAAKNAAKPPPMADLSGTGDMPTPNWLRVDTPHGRRWIPAWA